MASGILKHDAREIRDALQNNCFNVYCTPGKGSNDLSTAPGYKFRVIDARQHKGRLQVRDLYGAWSTVTERDVITLQ